MGRIGALAENTHPQIKDKIEEMLVSQKLEPSHAKEVVKSTWKDTPDDMAIKLTANLPEIFSRLKKEGVKVCAHRIGGDAIFFQKCLALLHFRLLFAPRIPRKALTSS